MPKETDSANEDKVKSSDNKYWHKKKKQEKLLYSVIFFYDWCKGCGICGALCPVEIIQYDVSGNPSIEEMDSCKGCRFCEIHCPDFAITVKQRYPDRREQKDDNGTT